MPHRRATALPPTSKTDCSSPPSLHRRPLPRLETDDTRTGASPLLPSTHKLMRTPPPADTRRVACGDGTHTFELPFVLLLDTFLTNTHRVAAPADSSSLSIFYNCTGAICIQWGTGWLSCVRRGARARGGARAGAGARAHGHGHTAPIRMNERAPWPPKPNQCECPNTAQSPSRGTRAHSHTPAPRHPAHRQPG